MKLDDRLKELDKHKSELDVLGALSTKQVQNPKRLFYVDFTNNSSAIEGNTYTLPLKGSYLMQSWKASKST
ncbi:hypothetical protein MASR2M78_06030 [Treponema sp.]